MPELGIGYHWKHRLDGRRRLPKDAPVLDTWWTAPGFRVRRPHAHPGVPGGPRRGAPGSPGPPRRLDVQRSDVVALAIGGSSPTSRCWVTGRRCSICSQTGGSRRATPRPERGSVMTGARVKWTPRRGGLTSVVKALSAWSGDTSITSAPSGPEPVAGLSLLLWHAAAAGESLRLLFAARLCVQGGAEGTGEPLLQDPGTPGASGTVSPCPAVCTHLVSHRHRPPLRRAAAHAHARAGI